MSSTYKISNIESIFNIQDVNDSTKKVTFDLSNISTSTIKTITIPNYDITLTGTSAVQTLTNKTISASNNTITGLANTDVGLGNVQNTKVKLDANTQPGVSDDTNSGYSIGSRWVDIITNKEYVCFDATANNAVWKKTTFDNEDMNVAQARRTTTYECTSSYVDLTFDETDIENDSSVVEHDDVYTERLIVKDTGLYQINVLCNFDSLAGSEPYIQLYKNGTIIICTEYTNSIGNNNSFPLVQFTKFVSLTANDYITLQIKDIGIEPSTLRSDAIFSVLRLTGTKGDPGPSGAGETNTISNIGTSGVGVYDSKVGDDLRLKKLNVASNKFSIVDVGIGENLDLDIVEANIVIGNLSGAPLGTVVGTSDSQTLTNKILTSITNNITSKSLHSATTVIDVSASTAPTTGQILTATSSTTATWQSISSFGDIVGPGSSTDNAIARFDSTTGKLIQNSGVIIDDQNSLTLGNATTGTISSSLELVLRQDGDTYGSSILRLRNRTGENGAIFETTDGSVTLVDFIFKTAINQRNIRYEARSSYMLISPNTSPEFQIGDPANPIVCTNDEKMLVRGDIDVTGIVDGRDIALDGSLQDSHISASSGIHGVSGSLVGTTDTQTLTNKTLTSTTNNIASKSLHSATTVISISGATAPSANQILTATSSTVATWQTPSTKVTRVGHTWAISGQVKVPSGDTDFIMPFFISLVSGQTAKIVSARYRINSGTSATVKVQKNGSDVTGFTSISVTTTDTTTDPTDVSIANNDKLALVVTAVNGTPKNLSFTLFVENTV